MQALLLALVGTVVGTLIAPAIVAGLKVSGNKIVDRNGDVFIIRGINVPYNWFRGDIDAMIPAVAATGANLVRIVLSDGSKYNKDDAASIKKVLDLCKNNKLVAMLEVHDGTGSNDLNDLYRAADFWISNAHVLKGVENRVIINIANEWMGSVDYNLWASGYRTVIQKLRRAGLNHLLCVDTAGWGQDTAAIQQRGKSVVESDRLRNLIFSVHMYEVAGGGAEAVQRSIAAAGSAGVPFIVGEFSDAQHGKPVAYKTILSLCKERNIGWIAWSWYGNSKDTANMDMSTAAKGSLTNLGNEIVNGPKGIRQTSRIPNIW